MKATCNYKPTKWEESTIDEITSEMKINKVSAVFSFDGGEIDGDAAVEYLMFYAKSDAKDMHNSIATYVGMLRMMGKLNGVAGTFVMSDNGTFDNGALNSTLTILPNSGTEGLTGITGTGKYFTKGTTVTMEFDYEI